MIPAFQKVAILGATGPTGEFMAREWRVRHVPIRVVSRNENRLSGAFGSLAIERHPADILDPEATRRAVDGCDLVINCIGLPLEHIERHPQTARNVAAAIRETGGRCIHVSSYWSFIPIRRIPLTEDHPRQGGGHVVEMRRRAEDILLDQGAAVVHLPDFYGPLVHTSILQRALGEATEGKIVNWIGALDVGREHVYVPDAMNAVASMAFHEKAYGDRWIMAGAGPITLREILSIVEGYLGRQIPSRTAGPFLLRLMSVFSRDLKALRPLIPTYAGPLTYDGSKLRRLLGEIPITPYAQAIPETLRWLASNRAPD